ERLGEWRRVGAIERRRQAAREGDAPRQRRRLAVVVADQEAADASEHLSDRERRRGGGEHGDERPAMLADRQVTGQQAADESAEPAHPAAVEEQGEERGFVEMLEDVEKLGAEEPADEAVDGGVESGVGQAGP